MTIQNSKRNKTQKGIASILLVMLILTVTFIIAMGIAMVMILQIKMSSRASDSIKAYQAADSGIEYALYQNTQGNPIDRICEDWFSIGSADYCLKTDDINNPTWIKSIGKAGAVRRAVQVNLVAP